jgi:pyruvate/2-oxoglutarate dehydrogenase complex dihydrolipoamide acyltransferase (E2) component
MNIVVAPELWATSILPEGLIERWFVSDGAMVKAGDLLAQIRIESALHDLTAPAAGRLSIESKVNSVVEPGRVIGRVAPGDAAPAKSPG